MAAPSGLPNGDHANDIHEMIRQLESGLVATVFFSKRKPERKICRVKLETKQLLWVRNQNSRPEGAVNLREVKDVRPGRNSKDFDKWPDELRRTEKGCAFVLFYGNDFKLKTFSLVASTPDEYTKWLRGLDFLRKETAAAAHPIIVERWLRREFYLMEKQNCITLKDAKAWMPRLNLKISNSQLRLRFQEVDSGGKGEIEFSEFSKLYAKLVYAPSVMIDYFALFIDQAHDVMKIKFEKFQHFLAQEQKDSNATDVNYVKNIINDFLEDALRAARGLYFTDEEFQDYLFSKHNTIWDSQHDKVSQDMNQPLPHYWIASSHNTYLTGDQFSSESSVEAYTRCLKMGCKCLELDCWDGADGLPYIYHGHTLTSKIKFLDVIKTIKEYAWVQSDFPLILSIENHCSLPQQRRMATAFLEVFGDELLTEPLSKDATFLPSPIQLKKKILLKHKKLKEGEDQWRTASISDDSAGADLADLSNSVRNGILYLEDPVDRGWHPHFFLLTSTKLYYTEQRSDQEQDEDAEDEENSLPQEGQPNDELHFSEQWFHGRLEGGRRRAEELLQQYSHLGDGTFLVRESETFVGDFSLSFWRQNKANHCRIKSRQEHGQTKYFLIDPVTFDSLYSLITHYRNTPLRGTDFSMTLKEPVPQPQSHEGKEWYHESLTRLEAEDMLSRIPHNGAFLVRKSRRSSTRADPDIGRFAISMRAEGKIKHCRIKQEGRLFMIGTAHFESLVELVQYYERHPLYYKMKLKYPVNEALVRRVGMPPDKGAIYGSPDLYMNPNDFQSKIRVKALHDYHANREDELSFRKGAVITNVHKQDGGWWRGDYSDKKQNWFPSNYVEEIENQDDTSESAPLGSLQKGSIDVRKCILERSQGPGFRRFAFKIFSQTQAQPLEIAADSEEKLQDWMAQIQECAEVAEQVAKRLRTKEKSRNIAREFSDLIVYCQAVQFIPDSLPGQYYEMSSFPETKVEKYVTKTKGKFFAKYNRSQLSRVYPKGQRVDSSNYDPLNIWNCGSQMVSLNYQTGDRPMQMNMGRFLRNGRCGYVLQPDCMRSENYDPFDKRTLVGVEPLTASIIVIGARHLVKSGRGIASPFVEIEIAGAEYDNNKFKTSTRADNGLNPVWNEPCVFDILCPPLALIRFTVQDEDIFGDPNFLGQATFPIECLRTGYRSVPLLNEYSEPLELSSLLVHIDIRNPKESEDSEIYASIQQLRDESEDLAHQLEEMEMGGDVEDASHVRQRLQATEERLLQKNEERKNKKSFQRQQVVYRRASNN
ncbi:1-phosphatidylinositol 4,5-bisphosphate phosphodiesterase gamma-1-like isoform X2 [Liolophura sinensis]|uniref:1-phosphatidylinositol 4,5-bisphosphate phosphodiesterase gamma-1-like isoform X2 n=1 Tax=Liolophura sinensis TaxID=3198878 RepID=UPI003158174B